MKGNTMNDQSNQSAVGISLLKGAAILGIAAIVSKLLGTMQKIPLQNIAGDEVFGIYNAVYPLYILILTLATAGLPIAISKFVAERTVLGQLSEAKRVLRLATWVLFVLGILFFGLLYYGADWFAWLIGIESSAAAIKSISFALLLVPFIAGLRGYFQGLQNMVPTAISQMIEQLFRVIMMVGLLLYFTRLGYDKGTIAAGATFGSVAGAIAGGLVMIYYWRREGKISLILDVIPPIRESAASIIRQFLRYALPICLGSIVLPILTLVDTFTMPRLLKSDGLSESGAMHLFGIYNHGLPLVQLIAMIATSMSVALVPSIAEAKLRRQDLAIRTRTEQALRMTWLIGLAASFGLATAALPINVMLYKSAEGWQVISIIAFTAVLSSINVVSGSILQGLGAVMAPVRNLLIAAVLKVILNLVLVPIYGIRGAAIAAVIAFGAACFLNLWDLRKSTQTGLALVQLKRPLIAIGVMCAVLWGSIEGLEWLFTHIFVDLSYRIMETLVGLVAIVLAAITYFVMLLRLKAITKMDLLLIPGFESKVLPFIQRLRLL
ncbi:polysaccharide biosynthesis protein [Paenibacillus psychroresistens]|uniref:Polysaccharide biosynthesis protein n=1 Tax=Paenibacillus psychroresistens TaxID=1778678 RepID=A0A6B8RAA2_9BACL|nr:polysaccharide biosynthesis protein [Paenibacillus psychroresistens]QGQ93691.1 polysaccharide biosynthesis protein [Paenibacillus psychroresistens]